MVLLDEKAVKTYAKLIIYGFNEKMRWNVAFEIYLFAGTQKGWKNSSKEEYHSYHCTYIPGTDAYERAKKLTSPPYNLKPYTIDSIKDFPEIWEEVSCLIWNDCM